MKFSYNIRSISANVLEVTRGRSEKIGQCNSVIAAYEMILLEEDVHWFFDDKCSLLEEQLQIAKAALENIKNNTCKDSVQGHAAIALDSIKSNND